MKDCPFCNRIGELSAPWCLSNRTHKRKTCYPSTTPKTPDATSQAFYGRLNSNKMIFFCLMRFLDICFELNIYISRICRTQWKRKTIDKCLKVFREATLSARNSADVDELLECFRIKFFRRKKKNCDRNSHNSTDKVIMNNTCRKKEKNALRIPRTDRYAIGRFTCACIWKLQTRNIKIKKNKRI